MLWLSVCNCTGCFSLPASVCVACLCHCSGSALLKSSSANLTRIFSIIRTQGESVLCMHVRSPLLVVIQFVLSLESESALAGLRASFAERESLCECVRLRGNSYYKEGHYCAATADYSRAIKLKCVGCVCVAELPLLCSQSLQCCAVQQSCPELSQEPEPLVCVCVHVRHSCASCVCTGCPVWMALGPLC